MSVTNPASVPLFQARVIVPDRVIERVVDGLTMLLDAETGHTFMLDDIGSRVWRLIASSGSIRETYDALLTEYSVAPEDLKRDIEELVENLRAKHLVEIAGG